MIRSDFHLHTDYCDGKNSPEEMVEAAIALGMTAIGFSVHAYTPFDESYCIQKEKMGAYIAEISALKKKYGQKLRILCGAERDLYGPVPEGELDYTVGSVHYVYKNGVYYTVDDSAEALKRAIYEAFDGDAMAFAEAYFAEYGRLWQNSPDVLGHFDLLTKFNERKVIFDEEEPRYIAAAKSAIDGLLPHGIPFEINTGAISRGYRTTPYPAPRWLRYIAERGGKVILSSDAHAKEGLLFGFEEAEALAEACGVKALVTL